VSLLANRLLSTAQRELRLPRQCEVLVSVWVRESVVIICRTGSSGQLNDKTGFLAPLELRSSSTWVVAVFL